jgi:hypothetical protein
MDRPSYALVVDQMATELAARRQLQSAYAALARAILTDDASVSAELTQPESAVAA